MISLMQCRQTININLELQFFSLLGLLFNLGLNFSDLLLGLLLDPGVLSLELFLVLGSVGHILKTKVTLNLIEILSLEEGSDSSAAELEDGGDVEVVGGHEELALGVEVEFVDELALPLILDEDLGVLGDEGLLDVGGSLVKLEMLAVVDDEVDFEGLDLSDGDLGDFALVVHEGLIDELGHLAHVLGDFDDLSVFGGDLQHTSLLKLIINPCGHRAN